MKDMVIAWTDGKAKEVDAPTSNFKINWQALTITSVKSKKVYRNTGFNKRWRPCAEVAGNIVRTFPFGALSPDFDDIPK